jgi:hypothetical protein
MKPQTTIQTPIASEIFLTTGLSLLGFLVFIILL